MTEMAVCAHYRLRHSEFLSWDKDDRDKAVEWHLRQAETCPNCDTRPQEWDEKRGGDRHAYTAEYERCRGCEVKQAGEAAMPKNAGRGAMTVLRRNREVT